MLVFCGVLFCVIFLCCVCFWFFPFGCFGCFLFLKTKLFGMGLSSDFFLFNYFFFRLNNSLQKNELSSP